MKEWKKEKKNRPWVFHATSFPKNHPLSGAHHQVGYTLNRYRLPSLDCHDNHVWVARVPVNLHHFSITWIAQAPTCVNLQKRFTYTHDRDGNILSTLSLIVIRVPHTFLLFKIKCTSAIGRFFFFFVQRREKILSWQLLGILSLICSLLGLQTDTVNSSYRHNTVSALFK